MSVFILVLIFSSYKKRVLRFFYLSMLLSMASIVSAQEEYEVLDDDPDFAQFSAQIGIGVETDFKFRTEIPITLDFHYDLKQLPFELDASFIGSVFSERMYSFYPDNLTENEFQNYNSFEVGATYNFLDKTAVKSLKVSLRRSTKQRSWGKEVTNYYLMNNGTVRRRFGLRSGIYRFAQSLTDYDSKGQSIGFSDGTTFPDAENAWNEAPSDNDDYFFTAERHLTTYFGFSFHRSSGLVLLVEPYGKRNAQSNVFLFADVLLDVASDLQKIAYNGKLYDLKEATSGVDLNRMGFRLGVKRVGTFIFYSFELGQRPTYFKPQLYGQILVGYSFNRNL